MFLPRQPEHDFLSSFGSLLTTSLITESSGLSLELVLSISVSYTSSFKDCSTLVSFCCVYLMESRFIWLWSSVSSWSSYFHYNLTMNSSMVIVPSLYRFLWCCPLSSSIACSSSSITFRMSSNRSYGKHFAIISGFTSCL